jgi:hypothetical protein
MGSVMSGRVIKNGAFLHAAATALALAAFAAILVLAVPRNVGLIFRYDFSTVVVMVALLLFIGYSFRGPVGTLVGLGVTLVIFALPLSGLWMSANSEPDILAGLLPWSDAGGYYYDANRLLDGIPFTPFTGRRPLFAGLLSVILSITGKNLQLSLAVLTLFTAVSFYMLGREIQRTHGTVAATLVSLLLFFFYRRFIGLTLTEHLGLSFGALGTALLWNGSSFNRKKIALLGLFVLTLALIARAGTFMILPLLAIWIAWFFRDKAAFSGKVFGLAVAVVILGFILNGMVHKFLVAPGSAGFDNFSHTLYGMARGGGWTRVYLDHPEIRSLPESEQARQIYALALESIRNDPLSLVKNMFLAWGQFFNLTGKSCVYCFFARGEVVTFGSMEGMNWTDIAGRVIVSLLALVGLGAAVFRHERRDFILFAAALGILLSVPFVPPWDADRMRVYAASIPFLAVFPAVGAAFILEIPGRVQLNPGKTRELGGGMLPVLSLLLVGLVILGPFIVKLTARPAVYRETTCPDGSSPIYISLNPGSFIKVVDNDTVPLTYLPDIRYSEFVRSLHNFPEYDITIELENNLKPPVILSESFDRKTGVGYWVAFNKVVPAGTGVIAVCGEPSNSPGLSAMNLFYADRVEEVSLK